MKYSAKMRTIVETVGAGVLCFGIVSSYGEERELTSRQFDRFPSVEVALINAESSYPTECPVQLSVAVCNKGNVPVEIQYRKGFPYLIRWSLEDEVRHALITQPDVLKDIFAVETNRPRVLEKEILTEKDFRIETISPGTAAVWRVNIPFAFKREGFFPMECVLPEIELRQGGRREKKSLSFVINVRVEKMSRDMAGKFEGNVVLVSKNEETGKALDIPVLKWWLKSEDGQNFHAVYKKGKCRIQLHDNNGICVSDVIWDESGGLQTVPRERDSFEWSIPLGKELLGGKIEFAKKTYRITASYRDFVPAILETKDFIDEAFYLRECDVSDRTILMKDESPIVVPVERVISRVGVWLFFQNSFALPERGS